MRFKHTYTNCKYLLHHSRKNFFVFSFVVSFLIFFANIIALWYYNVEIVWNLIQDKLGLYLYIHDDLISLTKRSEMIEDITSQMEKIHIEVEYISRDEALNTLTSKLPNLSKSLKTYNIKNPLPSVLYLKFSNGIQYNKIKDIVSKYKEFFLEWEKSNEIFYSEQQYRVEQVLSMVTTIRLWITFLWFILIIIILIYLYNMMRIIFLQFQLQLLLEKLLWEPYIHILLPFLLFFILSILLAFLLVLLYSILSSYCLNQYFLSIFSKTIYEFLFPWWYTLVYFHFWEFLFLLILSTITIIVSWLQNIKKIT